MANLLCESSSATHSSGSGRLCQAIGKSVKHGGGIELMTSIWSRAGLAIVLAALTQVGAAAIKPAERPHRPSAPPAKPEVRLAQAAPQRAAPKAAHAPAWLRDRIFPTSRWFSYLRKRMTRAMVGIDRGLLRSPLPLPRSTELPGA